MFVLILEEICASIEFMAEMFACKGSDWWQRGLRQWSTLKMPYCSAVVHCGSAKCFKFEYRRF